MNSWNSTNSTKVMRHKLGYVYRLLLSHFAPEYNGQQTSFQLGTSLDEIFLTTVFLSSTSMDSLTSYYRKTQLSPALRLFIQTVCDTVNRCRPRFYLANLTKRQERTRQMQVYGQCEQNLRSFYNESTATSIDTPNMLNYSSSYQCSMRCEWTLCVSFTLGGLNVHIMSQLNPYYFSYSVKIIACKFSVI